MKSVQNGVFSGPYFPVFGLNTGKYGPEKTPYLGTFHGVLILCILSTRRFDGNLLMVCLLINIGINCDEFSCYCLGRPASFTFSGTPITFFLCPCIFMFQAG